MLSPSIGADLAGPVADIYRDAELLILERIAWALSQDMDAPDWEVRQLARLQRVREEVLAILAKVNPEAATAILAQLDEAYGLGALSAFQDIAPVVPPVAPIPDARALAVVALARETSGAVASAQRSVLRAVDDVYARVIGDAVAQVATGTVGRQAATQRALVAFLGKGLTFIDTRRGRMNIADYATMAVRTAAARVAVQAHVDTQRAAGLELVVIKPGPRACDICDKWARLILTTGTETGELRLPNLRADGFRKVTVSATLDEARAAGWGHPNCRCSVGAYLPGVTRPETLERPPWDADAYEAQQRQRAIERQIRGWKTRQAVAITEAERAETRGRIRGWQAAMREHLAAHPDLKRQSAREQITGTLSSAEALRARG